MIERRELNGQEGIEKGVQNGWMALLGEGK